MCTHVPYWNLLLTNFMMVFQPLTGQRISMYPWRLHMAPVWILLALLCGVLNHLCQQKKLAGLPFLTSHPLWGKDVSYSEWIWFFWGVHLYTSLCCWCSGGIQGVCKLSEESCVFQQHVFVWSPFPGWVGTNVIVLKSFYEHLGPFIWVSDQNFGCNFLIYFLV